MKEIISKVRYVWDECGFVSDQVARAKIVSLVFVLAEKEKTNIIPNEPAFLETRMPKWLYCPLCGEKEITHTSKVGKTYFACFKCNKFLNEDGSITDMTKTMK